MNNTVNIIKRRRNNNYINKKKLWLIAIAVLFLMIFFSAYFISKTVTAAQRNTDRNKLITSVEIKRGDTLWSIAADYITEEYNNIAEYVEEIKITNGLVSDTIHTGNFIIVPYYADAIR